MNHCTGDPNIGPLPDFLIIGAAKSGTTTLYKYLCLHPEIYMSNVKEPCFFDADMSWHKGWDWYRSLFDGARNGQVCGEASTNYTRFPQVPGVPEKISKFLPDVKLIYILRDPVERAYSHYVHMHTKEVFPGKPFELSFEEFIEQYPACIDSSDYLMQIQQYLNYIPIKNMLFLQLEQLKRDPKSTLSKVFEFLCLKFDFDIPLDEKLHLNSAASFQDSRFPTRVTGPVKNIPVVKTVYTKSPRFFREFAYSMIRHAPYARKIKRQFSPPQMSPQMRDALGRKFAKSNRELSKLISIDLSN